MVLSLAWYRPEDYGCILSIMKDAHDLPETYEAWLQSARNVEKAMQRQGVPTLQVVLDPDAFLAFCAREGREPVAGTRSHYAAIRAQAMMAPPALPPSASSPFARFLTPPK